MTTPALLAEIVLTGVLMLLALFLPSLCDGSLRMAPTAEMVTLVIALGFVLGVVVDRLADSILGRWEGYARCCFAHFKKVRDQREAILGSEEAPKEPFPEDWMKMQMMTCASPGVVDWMNQLRTRIRISRAVSLLAPALTTSGMLALNMCTAAGWTADARLFTVLHVLVLAAVFLAAQPPRIRPPAEAPKKSKWDLAPPKTEDFPKECPSPRVFYWSPASLWLAFQFVASVALLVGSTPQSLLAMFGLFFLGAAVTATSVVTWLRISRTFMQFLWDYAHMNDVEGLARAFTGNVSWIRTPINARPPVLPR